MQNEKNSKVLEALLSKNQGRPPVWLMRQAGRYLPEYRALREKYTLRDLFFTPELAARITLLPVDLIGVDAAILFSDITVIALALGLKLAFQEGPQIEPLVTSETVTGLRVGDVRHILRPIQEAIRITKPQLRVPLIGFCGGPFTVASYLLEKHSGSDLPLTKKWLYQNPKTFEQLLEKITQSSIEYLKMQVDAGVDAIQIFDSWAHVLSQHHFQKFCVPYLKRLAEAVSVPVILFMRGACLRVEELASLKPSCISFDWQTPLSLLRAQIPQGIALQGNLDPDLLYAPLPVIRQGVEELLNSMDGDPGFIVNLGHGVKPDVPVNAVRCLVEAVKRSHN